MRPVKALLAALVFLLVYACQKEPDFITEPPPTPPVANAPLILSFSPAAVKIGEEVTIKGKYFDTAVANNKVSVNGTGGTVLSANDSTIRFRVAPGSATGKISLVTGGRAVVTATDLQVIRPVILSFAPDSVQVGEEVLIKGKFFNPVAANNRVLVAGAAGSIEEATDTTIRFRVGPSSSSDYITLITGADTVVSNSELLVYAPPADPWTQKADFPEALAPAPAINGLVLSFSSATAGYIYKSNKLWQYSPATNTWTRKADMPSARAHNFGFCFAIGNKAYLGLGAPGEAAPPSHMTKEVWEYDMATDVWTRKSDFPGSKRSGCFSFAIGNRGYLGGGDTMNGAFNSVKDFWSYDPQTDTWTQLPDYPGAKLVGSMGTGIQGKGFVFEGSYGSLMATFSSFTQFNVWSYDPQAASWQQKTSLSMPAGKPATSATFFSINNRAYAALGSTDHTTVGGVLTKKDFWEYDPQADAWTEKPQVGGPVRYFPCSFAVAGKGYVGMGTGTQVFQTLSDFWQYTP